MKKPKSNTDGLRCKQGDRAVIVRPPMPALQKLVGSYLECEEVCAQISGVIREPVWHVKPLSPMLAMMQVNHMPDSCLRPLRDGDGADETIGWAGVPNPAKVPS